MDIPHFVYPLIHSDMDRHLDRVQFLPVMRSVHACLCVGLCFLPSGVDSQEWNC